MSAPLFDTTRLERGRARARKGGDGAMFLHARALEQVSERLAEVNRSFTDTAIYL